MTKYVATRRNPEGPKARQVSVPSRNAATKPDRDKPETRIGEPNVKIRTLLRRADCHEGGDDWSSAMACCTKPRSTPLADARIGVCSLLRVIGVLDLGLGGGIRALEDRSVNLGREGRATEERANGVAIEELVEAPSGTTLT